MFWKIDRDIETKLDKIGADPYFVRYILSMYNVSPAESPKENNFFSIEKWGSSAQRKIKRNIQKNYGTNWNVIWKLKHYSMKDLFNREMRENLFYMCPEPSKKPGRPREDNVWAAVYHLRNYFMKITSRYNASGVLIKKGNFCMSLISEIFGKDCVYLNEEWSEKKKNLKLSIFPASPVESTTDELLKMYESQKEIIREALDTNTPLYEIRRRKSLEAISITGTHKAP